MADVAQASSSPGAEGIDHAAIGLEELVGHLEDRKDQRRASHGHQAEWRLPASRQMYFAGPAGDARPTGPSLSTSAPSST